MEKYVQKFHLHYSKIKERMQAITGRWQKNMSKKTTLVGN